MLPNATVDIFSDAHAGRRYRTPRDVTIQQTAFRHGVGSPWQNYCCSTFCRGDLTNESLKEAQIVNLTAPERHSRAIGLPFTRMITIHWQAAGVGLADMVKATGRFLDLLTKALARHDNKTAWLWILENGDRKGGHCHLLVHVPAVLVSILTRLQKGWLKRISGRKYLKSVVHSKPIGGRLGLETGNVELHAINLAVALGYVLKGANSEAAAKFRLARLEAGGRIIGKRCGTSQNIGAKARKSTDRI